MAPPVVTLLLLCATFITLSTQAAFGEQEADNSREFPNEYCRFEGQLLPHPHSPCRYLQCVKSEDKSKPGEGFLFSREVVCPRKLAVDDRVFTIMNNYMIKNVCTSPDDRCDTDGQDSSYSVTVTTISDREDRTSAVPQLVGSDAREAYGVDVGGTSEQAADDPNGYSGWQSYGAAVPGHQHHYVSRHELRSQVLQSQHHANQPYQAQQNHYTTTPVTSDAAVPAVNSHGLSAAQVPFYTPQPTPAPTPLSVTPINPLSDALERYRQMVANRQQAAIRAQQLHLQQNHVSHPAPGGNPGVISQEPNPQSQINGIKKESQNKQRQFGNGQYPGYQSLGGNNRVMNPKVQQGDQKESSHPVIQHQLHPTYRLPVQSGQQDLINSANNQGSYVNNQVVPAQGGYINNQVNHVNNQGGYGDSPVGAVPSSSIVSDSQEDREDMPTVKHPTFFRLIQPNNPNTQVAKPDPNSNIYRKLTDDVDLPGAKYVYMDPVPGYYLVYPTISE